MERIEDYARRAVEAVVKMIMRTNKLGEIQPRSGETIIIE